MRQDWALLAAPTPSSTSFCPETIAGLVEPARQCLSYTIAPGTPLWQSVEVSMVGQVRARRRLLDLVPVVTATGPDLARSAAGRLASEIARPAGGGGPTVRTRGSSSTKLFR